MLNIDGFVGIQRNVSVTVTNEGAVAAVNWVGLKLAFKRTVNPINMERVLDDASIMRR